MPLLINEISYLAAAAAFAIVSIFLFIGWKGRYRGALLMGACATTFLWALTDAFADYRAGISALVEAMDELKAAIWILFIWEVLAAARKGGGQGILPYFRTLFLAVVAIWLFFVMFLQAGYMHPLLEYYLVSIIGHVLLAVTGMVLIEQLYRNTHPDSRWGIKFMCLAVGTMFAYDFFLYSDAMLFRRVNVNLWAARGIVNAFVAPLAMVSAARNPQWSLKVHLSRHVVFHTASLFGAGIYLLVMAGAGYYIRIFGGKWGSVLQIAFLFGASLLLLTIFFSGTLRSRLKVFLFKHFFSYKYDYREEWLKFTRTLTVSGEGEALYEHAIKAIAALVDSPAGLLWMKGERNAYSCVAGWNAALPGVELSGNDSMIVFLLRSRWVINLDEYVPHPELYGDLEIPEWLQDNPKAWLVVPVMLNEDLLGFIVLMEPRSEFAFNWESCDLVKAAGHQLANSLAQKRANDALLVARQFDSFNRMSAFVVHDLKNLVAQLSLMLSNAEKHKNNPEFQEDMLSTVDNSVQKMKKLLSQLRSGQGGENRASRISLSSLLKTVLQDKSALKPRPTLALPERDLFVLADGDRLVRVVGHVVQNACEATHYDGSVEARLLERDGMAVIEVEDNGSGMDESFVRERLFRPFDSTKSSGMGVGAHECREYVRELGGNVEVESEPGQGTLFRIILPVSVKIDGQLNENGVDAK
ncbi:MAG: PEP-CTERM system histidine kinase PrsK [Burkholderiales bacterium]|nr:PEP-CTERM system histidine kinase PrsK [Burkholderiales bacterium]